MKLEAKQRLQASVCMDAAPSKGPIKTGAFHEWLGKSPDSPITNADIDKGLKSNDPHVRKMANFARNARSWKH